MEAKKIDKSDNSGIKLILPIVEEAYHQEQNALEKWDRKADNLTRYISIYLVLYNLLVSLVNSKNAQGSFSIQFTRCDYIVMLIPALISLIFAITGQALSRIGFFPNAEELFDMFKSKPEKYKNEGDLLQYKLMSYNKFIKILRRNNLVKKICVFISYIGYFISIIILACNMYTIL